MAKVLVVDDAKIMRINIINMLDDLGHVVVAEATDGSMGVEMYKKHLPDVVTMDITMPCENGIEDGIDAVKAIRKDFPEAKIIMITSHGEQDKVIKAIQYGASNYLLKPIKIEKLEEVLKKTLG
jgi:two-component system chemotaxis response regulator CheY